MTQKQKPNVPFGYADLLEQRNDLLAALEYVQHALACWRDNEPILRVWRKNPNSEDAMTLTQVCSKIVTDKTAMCIRSRKDAPQQYDVKPMFTGNKHGWTLLDLFTASAINSVANAINDINRDKLNSLPPLRAAEICFSLLKG